MSRTALAHVTDWIFDLDNTLYPRHCDLFAQIDVLITRYVMEVTGLAHDEARALQKQFYNRYGTSLRGLMSDYRIDPEHYLATVHAIDYSGVLAHPELVAAIAALPGRKFIFTNADSGHAEAVLARIGCADLFDGLFDIRNALFEPKPARGAYERFLLRYDIDPTRAVMFDDLEKNLLVPHELGMATVQIVPSDDHVRNDRDAWDPPPATATAHVHYITADLAGFLTPAQLAPAPR